MNQDQIIQMMKKVVAENQSYTTWTVSTPHLVALVNHAIEVEREACAQIADKHTKASFTYEQVKAHIRAASMFANDISVGSDTTEDGVSIVIRRRDEILYAEFFAYTTPPQRTWVGLTDDELEKLIHNFGSDPHTLLDEVDARLKARNT